MEQAATRALRRGAIAVAVTALKRAADLGEAASRGRRRSPLRGSLRSWAGGMSSCRCWKRSSRWTSVSSIVRGSHGVPGDGADEATRHRAVQVFDCHRGNARSSRRSRSARGSALARCFPCVVGGPGAGGQGGAHSGRRSTRWRCEQRSTRLCGSCVCRSSWSRGGGPGAFETGGQCRADRHRGRTLLRPCSARWRVRPGRRSSDGGDRGPAKRGKARASATATGTARGHGRPARSLGRRPLPTRRAVLPRSS